MYKQFFRVLAVVCLIIFCSLADAEEFEIKSYKFIGDLAGEGGVRLWVEKDSNDLNILLSSTGGALATVAIHPSKAKAVGNVLLQAEDYYDRHQHYYLEKKNSSTPLYREEYTQIVKTEGYEVVFQSASRGEDFSVKVGLDKSFNPMALMTRQEAISVGKRLLKGEELAEFVNRHITF